MEALRNSVGALQKFESPFGSKPIVYADWIASGRCLESIEQYIQQNVLPYYGNTHTTTSRTGHQSTCFRQEARQIVAECVNAKITGRAAEDSVLFIGQGTTSAVDKLVAMLGLQHALMYDLEDALRPVVFCSSYEHHSNLLPWRECGADVIEIQYNPVGGVDLVDLEAQLKKHADRKVKIGAFSAASNVTGILTDVDGVAILLHQHNALAFFDYATAAPHVTINMNPVNPLAKKDAVYFSGHKFLGGPGSSGVLIVKRFILPQAYEPPSVPGGGTVFYVTNDHHRYLTEREEREEGGSPQLLGDVKLALSMNLMREVGAQTIAAREEEIMAQVHTALQADPRIVLLGHPSSHSGASSAGAGARHLPIFSFLIRAFDRFLHFHFVSVLLNDLFGIQCRGGCMCAGPYAQRLLGLSPENNQNLERSLLDKHEILRPGFTRLSFSYWMPAEEVTYITKAVLFVAEHGWKFLPLYRYNHKTGEWAHTTRLTRFPERLWLSNFSLASSSSSASTTAAASSSVQQTLATSWHGASLSAVFAQVFEVAEQEVAKLAAADAKKSSVTAATATTAAVVAAGQSGVDFFGETEAPVAADVSHESTGIARYDHLRWYLLPSDLQSAGFASALTTTGRLMDLRGPIHPELFGQSPTTTTAINTAPVVELTAYAATRDRKLASRTGHEDHVPRFLRLLQEADGSESLLFSLKLHNIRLRGTDKDRQPATSSSVTAETAPVVVPSETATTVAPKAAPAKNKAATKAILAEAFATATTTTATTTSATSGGDDDCVACSLTADCSTGECTLRERANGYENNFVVEDGKILSGPGNYFPATIPTVVTNKFITPPKKMMKLVGQAIKEWGMIQDGDRLLLGLSGGKDSLALLHTLRALQIRAPVKFEFACATVDPQTTSFDPSPLIPYVQSLGITYHYLSQPIIQLAKSKLQGDSLCAFCARFKRGLLYSCCRTYGYTKLVLAQHLDDVCESFMMSLLHNGQTRTMKAKYLNEAGDITIIRPFIYLREAQARDFSMQSALNIINENCPACFEQPKERARMKKLLQQEEAMVPNLFYNLKRALVPLMHDDTYEVLKNVADKIAAAGNERYDYNTCSRKKGRSTEDDGDEHHHEAASTKNGATSATTAIAAAVDTTDGEPAAKKLREDPTLLRTDTNTAMAVDGSDL